MKKVNHWINGKNVAGNDYFQTTNPATGEVLADVASGGEAEINQAVAAAKEACNFAFFSGLIGAQFWAERVQPKSPELDAKLLVSC